MRLVCFDACGALFMPLNWYYAVFVMVPPVGLEPEWGDYSPTPSTGINAGGWGFLRFGHYSLLQPFAVVYSGACRGNVVGLHGRLALDGGGGD